MKNIMIKIVLLLKLALTASVVFALDSDVENLQVINPPHSNGIQIGDVMNRTIQFETAAQYQLPKSALPIKGEVRNGIEVREATIETAKRGDKSRFTVKMSYQIFTSAAKPMVMQLPKENFVLSGGAKPLSVEMPAWSFWFSPLVSEGLKNAKQHLQPQYKPELVNLSTHHTQAWLALASVVFGFIGLIYVNADRHWLPLMNGAFAQAHRKLKSLPKNQSSYKHALMLLHQAFNTTHGGNLFESDLEHFLAKNPKFSTISADIKTFFERSNAMLFSSKHMDDGELIPQLILLSKKLRDCERGVK